ncbi:MAG: CDP-alcohol phosphatidyltransferase family protein [Kiritimatiellae bacterium]|nr:CDP-alcohol phosphatidyltransferase family protein [Kiritimatiellia bacterium]
MASSQLSTSKSQSPRGTRGQFLFVNALTLSRGPLLLLFMAGVLVGIYHPYPWLKWLNLALLVVSSVTDLFDGLLARKWNVTSRLGAVFDPMMDKVFFIIVFPTLTMRLFLSSGVVFGVLSSIGHVRSATSPELSHAILMLILTVTYILRDQWVMALRALAADGGADMKANWVGKTRTALSFPIGCLLYCYIAFGWRWLTQPIMMGVEIFAIVLNIYSFIAYTRRYALALKR